MNAKERVYAQMEGRPVDRIPNLSLIMQFAARYINVPYGKYVTDYRYLVDANIKCCEKFGLDMVSAISDPFRETAAFGADVLIKEDDVPLCPEHFLDSWTKMDKLVRFDPMGNARTADRINAIRLYKTTVGDEYPICGWIEGPVAESCDLRGINQLMYDLYDEPDAVRELLQICLEQGIQFAEAQIQAGADFIGIGDAAASVIGPVLYKEFAFEYQKQLVSKVQKMGAKVKLHICGDINPILPLLKEVAPDMLDIDFMVDFKSAVKIIDNKIALCGNINPVSTILEGNEKTIDKSVGNCIADMNNKSFISSGCEIPKYTSTENMLVFKNSIDIYSK
ncbi:MAG: uroporphyrinogen decarboxylase family protein [Bacillota bacterium]|nr:uroporphyrinogen decarboxylase family protein [Bacillota bacterium]